MSTKKKTPKASKKAPSVLKTMAKSPKKRLNVLKKEVPATKPSFLKRLHLGMHLAIAGSAIGILLILGIVDRATFSTGRSSAQSTLPATIGVEHDGPLTLSILVARKEKAGYVSLTNRSDDEIHLSVPSGWQRSEVTGVPISEVTADIPVFGFTRWTLPARAGMKMLLSTAPQALFFDSTSNSSAAIDVQTVDLTTLEMTSRVVLLQKQLLVPLWGDVEQ